MSLLLKIFGDPNARALKAARPIVASINQLESTIQALTPEELRAKTAEFKSRLAQGSTLEELLPEAFAVVREAARRTTGMRHFDVQLIGGLALHQGKIAEMRTGEGKTLVATLPVYLNALTGKGVHVVTVNDYLAKRDAVWMGQIYDYLGLSVGVIQNLRVSYIYDAAARQNEPGMEIEGETSEEKSFRVQEDFLRPASRREVYHCDITYGTNNEFGFDYLRDNMVQSLDDMVMRTDHPMHYAIIDEVDSILVDEARTPLIISAPAEEANDRYYQFAHLVRNLQEKTDYNVDEKLRTATLTEAGIAKFENWLNLENIYTEGGIRTVHHIEQALKAEVLFKRDKDYIVEGKEVIIIDEFTGRKMPGRRYSEGLHQAIEAKEGVDIKRESQTLATITFQNLFRMYNKLAGMTGTALTEAEEFGKIYNLDVLVVPTNRPDQRLDHPDRIYKTETAKYNAIVEKVQECRAKGQPILVGTISVEKNEQVSAFLTAAGIAHEILNAKNHEREGEIIAQAGRPGAVTLATNMAGRGVDIKLGGVPLDQMIAEKVIQAGGLFVLGTERHESRRIDNQLRGRAARQGDPGETQFFVSTEDDLMRIFAGERMRSVMERLKVPDNMPVEQRMITKLLESAQKKVEGYHFDLRKHLLEYDDVLNKHREIIYRRRREILSLAAGQSSEGAGALSLKDLILSYIEQEMEFVVSFHTNAEDRGEWNLTEIFETARTIFSFSTEEKEQLFKIGEHGDSKLDEATARNQIVEFLLTKAGQEYSRLEARIQEIAGVEKAGEMAKDLEKNVLLRTIDNFWVDHLVAIDYLRTGIGLRGYGQRDPLVEYKRETYHMFNELLSQIQKEVVYSFFKISAGLQLAPSVMASDKLVLKGAQKSATDISSKPRDEQGNKIGRNDLCPCGSGKKYKKCCGK